MQATDLMLCIDPLSHHFEHDVLFDETALQTGGENIMSRFTYMRDWFAARGVRMHTADRLLRGEVGARLNVVMSFGLQKRYKALARRDDVILSAFFAFESPIVEPSLYRRLHETQEYFKRVYSFSDCDSLMPVLTQPVKLEKFCLPYPFDAIRDDLWRKEDRQFLVMINHNKLPAIRWKELYTERMRAVEFFAKNREMDLYGRGWNDPSFQMGIGWMPGTLQHLLRFGLKQWQRIRPVPALEAARTVYKGSVPSKLAVLSRYTFCLCFDNAMLNGWVTEKIFDCFVAGSIPIYWGAPDIERYVPPQCFIDMRRFNTYEELRRFLKALGPSEIRAYKNAAREYMQSPQFEPFKTHTFVELLGRLVEEDTGVALRAVA